MIREIRRPPSRGGALAACILMLTACAVKAQTEGSGQTVQPQDTSPVQPAGSQEAQESSGLFNFMDELPELIDQSLPSPGPSRTYWYYARPHVGNPLEGKYFSLDQGMWYKPIRDLELNVGPSEFIWKDPYAQNRLRYGFYQLTLGLKYDLPLKNPVGAATSFGVNFTTPISHPPSVISDGWRHTDPFVSYRRPLVPKWKLVGYSTLGLDMLAHTGLPGTFGFDALHSNSITFSVGASREWRRFTGSFTVSGATSLLMANTGRQVVTLSPQVFVPLFPKKLRFARFTATLGPNEEMGPDGSHLSFTTSIHLDLKSRATGGH